MYWYILVNIFFWVSISVIIGIEFEMMIENMGLYMGENMVDVKIIGFLRVFLLIFRWI